MIKNKSYFETYIYVILTAIVFLTLLNGYNFNFEIFSDRDLIRSQNLLHSFQVYGADLGMQNGRRIPGGFNYYYLYILTNISKNILILNYINLFVTLFSFIFLLKISKKWININGALFSIIFFLTSSTFIIQLTRFWNPSLGLPFIIFSIAFFLNFLDKKKKLDLFLTFAFIFFASQFHISYSVFFAIFSVLILIFGTVSFLKLILVIIVSFIFAYLPLILNLFFTLIDRDINDYYLIYSIKNDDVGNQNVLIWFSEKIFSKIHTILNYLFDKKLLTTIIVLSLVALTKILFIIKNSLFLKKNKKNLFLIFLFTFLIVLILFYSEISNEVFIYFSWATILGIISIFLITKKNIFLKYNSKNSVEYINIIYFIFFFSVIVLSLTYSLTYGIVSINAGGSSRYNLSILPIYSIIVGYCLAVIYEWSKTQEKIKKNIILFSLTIIITFKTIISFYPIFYKINDNRITYNQKIFIVDTLIENYDLSKNDFFTKVGFGVLDNQMKVSNFSKPSFEFYIRNKVSNKKKEFDNCLLVLIDKKKNFLHKKNQEIFLKNLSNRKDLFGSIINIQKKLFFNEFLILEYKPIYGDCVKNILNDYILTKNEKETLKFLTNKNNNQVYYIKNQNLNKYFLNISGYGMLYPVDLMIKIKQKQKKLNINLYSKRLRNSDTFLNGYWDSAMILNPKIIFEKNDSTEIYIIPLLDGFLGEGFKKTPWSISTTLPKEGIYTISFVADKLKEKFNKKTIDKINFLVDDNFNFKYNDN